MWFSAHAALGGSKHYRHCPQPDAIAGAILYAIEQPEDGDVGELVVSSIASPFLSPGLRGPLGRPRRASVTPSSSIKTMNFI